MAQLDRQRNGLRGSSKRRKRRKAQEHAEAIAAQFRRQVRNQDWYDHKHQFSPAHSCRACSGKTRARGPYQWHHVIPAAQGGKYELRNLVPLCASCHELVHEIWGGGLEYTGPVKRRQFIARVRAIVRSSRDRAESAGDETDD